MARKSPPCANFIVNTGNAQAADMDALIRHVQGVVQQAHGLQLHPEVMRLGYFANSRLLRPNLASPSSLAWLDSVSPTSVS